ncbi:hypothetical protein ACM3AF_003585 [Escherichia coli]
MSEKWSKEFDSCFQVSLKKKGRNEVSLRNKAAAENLPPCCPLTFNFVG